MERPTLSAAKESCKGEDFKESQECHKGSALRVRGCWQAQIAAELP